VEPPPWPCLPFVSWANAMPSDSILGLELVAFYTFKQEELTPNVLAVLGRSDTAPGRLGFARGWGAALAFNGDRKHFTPSGISEEGKWKGFEEGFSANSYVYVVLWSSKRIRGSDEKTSTLHSHSAFVTLRLPRFGCMIEDEGVALGPSLPPGMGPGDDLAPDGRGAKRGHPAESDTPEPEVPEPTAAATSAGAAGAAATSAGAAGAAATSAGAAGATFFMHAHAGRESHPLHPSRA
jgi:hypothetical protein